MGFALRRARRQGVLVTFSIEAGDSASPVFRTDSLPVTAFHGDQSGNEHAC